MAILWKKDCELDIKVIKMAHEGRTIIAMLKYDNVNILLLNIYAPNSVKERKNYFNLLSEEIEKASRDHCQIYVAVISTAL